MRGGMEATTSATEAVGACHHPLRVSSTAGAVPGPRGYPHLRHPLSAVRARDTDTRHQSLRTRHQIVPLRLPLPLRLSRGMQELHRRRGRHPLHTTILIIHPAVGVAVGQAVGVFAFDRASPRD